MVLAATADRPLLGVGISADGSQLAVATGREILRLPRAGGAPVALPTTAFTYDVELVGPAATMITTSQAEDDAEWETRPFGGSARLLHGRDERELVAVAPDGETHVYAAGYAIYIERAGETSSSKLVALSAGERVPALAWSPDGTQLAFVRWRSPTSDASIEVVAAAGGTPSRLLRRRFPPGEPRAFGWLDAARVIYAVNGAEDAAITVLDVARLEEVELAREPGAIVLAGRAAGGAFAYLAGTPRGVLRTGNARDPLAPLVTVGAVAATGLGGWTDDGRFAVSVAGGAPLAVDATGVATAWAGGKPGDRLITTLDGSALALRDVAQPGDGIEVWQLGADPRPILGIEHDPSITTLRCAEDRTAPCVRATMARGDALRYVHWDPRTGRDAEQSGLLSDRPWGADHAVSATGAVAAVHGTDELYVYPPFAERRRYIVTGGVALDRVAWMGAQLIVTGRGWRGHPWVALRVTLPASVAEPTVALLDESAATSLGVPRAAADGRIAIARTDLDVQLIVVTP